MKRAGYALLSALVLVMVAGFFDASAKAQLTAATGAMSSGFPAWELRGSASLPGGSLAAGSQGETLIAVLAQPLRRALIVLHVLGTTIGFGAALFLDLFLLRNLYRRAIDGTTLQLVKFGSKLVSAGLAMLWFSGAGFLAVYSLTTPELLGNPKIWAKLSVVLLLTLNGVYLHRQVFIALEQCLGRPLMAQMTTRKALLFIIPASLSATGWGFAFVLGLVKELNNSTSVAVFMAAYCAALLATVLIASGVHWIANRQALVDRTPQGAVFN